MGVSDALREYCVTKAERLPRFLDRIQSIEVVVQGKDGAHLVEMIVRSAGTTPFVAQQSHEDAFAAVDLVLDKIEEQLRRYKERLRNRKHPPRAAGPAPAE